MPAMETEPSGKTAANWCGARPSVELWISEALITTAGL
jgi:hypothetical protein